MTKNSPDLGFSPIDEDRLTQPLKRKTDAWPHQCAAYSFAKDLPGAMLAMEMGTGKTKTAIDLVANWGVEGNILVVCPKAVVATWPHEFAKHYPADDVYLCPLEGKTVQKRETAELVRIRERMKTIVYVVNYESAILSPLKEWLIQQQWGCVVYDESHRIKSPGGRISKTCAQIARRAERKLLLTGTPMPHSPLDLYGQFRAINQAIFGTSFVRFRAKYAVTHPDYKSMIFSWQNLDELKRTFFAHAFRVRSEDVLDLPETIDSEIHITLCDRARKIYDRLESEMVTQIGEGELTVANVMVQLLRLQQITGGTVPDDDGNHREVDDGKYQGVRDIAQDIDSDEPIVVFCRFRSDIDMVQRAAAKLNRSFGELSGRANDLAGNQLPVDIDGNTGYLFAVQIASGGAGVDLTRACHCIYYSLGFSLGEYEQSRARLHRPGQTRPVRYYHLIATDTVDRRVYDTLRKREDLVGSILNSYVGGK